MINIDKKIVRELQGNIPLGPAPFRTIAVKLGLTEKKLLEKIAGFKRSGKLRSIRAIVRHRKAGYTANAMVVWSVPGAKVPSFGKTAAASQAVSHCYERFSPPGWPYNLYTMMHGRSRAGILKEIEGLKKRTGIRECRILESGREFKKTSMVYF